MTTHPHHPRPATNDDADPETGPGVLERVLGPTVAQLTVQAAYQRHQQAHDQLVAALLGRVSELVRAVFPAAHLLAIDDSGPTRHDPDAPVLLAEVLQPGPDPAHPLNVWDAGYNFARDIPRDPRMPTALRQHLDALLQALYDLDAHNDPPTITCHTPNTDPCPAPVHVILGPRH